MYLLVDAYYSENGGDVIVDIVSRLCRRCRTFFGIRWSPQWLTELLVESSVYNVDTCCGGGEYAKSRDSEVG